MKITVPKYYKKFKCKADKCNHNCCIGWEIDIDDKTYELYKDNDNRLGGRSSRCISTDGSIHFILDSNERCPFLNDRGLCDIITTLGENALCQICADHPRFRNFFTTHTETGLGLCCEEAARIIITETDAFKMPDVATDNEQESLFFKLRQNIFDILQDRDFPFDERVENLFIFLNVKVPDFSIKKWRNTLLSLEVLDDDWRVMINKAKDRPINAEFDTEFEQLACYFIFRHLANALSDGLYAEWAMLCILFCKIIAAIAEGQTISPLTIIDAARALSSELEYSDENIDIILDTLIDERCRCSNG